LFTVDSDDSDFAGTDFPVDLGERTGEGRITWGKRATQDTLLVCGFIISSASIRTAIVHLTTTKTGTMQVKNGAKSPIGE
jgi:hypothetical protein